MLIRSPRGWELPERLATPEALMLGRRYLLGGAATLAAVGLAGTAQAAEAPLPPGALRFKPGRPLTPAHAVETYNNYYEFGTSKSIWRAAQRLHTSPWSLRIEGMVHKPTTIALDTLLKQVTQDERVYRHRCVEAWAITVPWTGFPLSQLVKIANPLASAKYMVFQTLDDPKQMPGISGSFFPWPYVEGVTMAEANNELAYVGTGLYGKNLLKQNGAPIRIVLPWKYGFKSVKSIVKITFTDKQPMTFWKQIAPDEYGFWANVNPAVPHPRWSQARERLIGTGKTVPTQIYNGYGQWVSSLYAGMPQTRTLFM